MSVRLFQLFAWPAKRKQHELLMSHGLSRCQNCWSLVYSFVTSDTTTTNNWGVLYNIFNDHDSEAHDTAITCTSHRLQHIHTKCIPAPIGGTGRSFPRPTIPSIYLLSPLQPAETWSTPSIIFDINCKPVLSNTWKAFPEYFQCDIEVSKNRKFQSIHRPKWASKIRDEKNRKRKCWL